MSRHLNRRQWLAASGLACLAGCASNKGTGFYGYALTANAGDNSVAAVDLTTFRVTSTIPLSASPTQIVAAADIRPTRQAYVLTPANGSVHLIDAHMIKAKSRRMADFVSQIALADDKSVLALAPHSNEVIQADSATLNPTARHKFSIKADTMDFAASGYVAVASSEGAVELLNLSNGQRSRTDTPPLGQIRFRGDGKILLAANVRDRSLLALDVPSLKVVAELPLSMKPENLCFNSDLGQMFVSGDGMDGVAVVFPYNTLEVDQTLLTGRAPGTMVCSATPAYLFVASNSSSDVCILNIETRKVIGFVEMGGKPTFLTVTPDSQYALVLDQGSGDMGVIHIPAIKVRRDAARLRNGAGLFAMISVGSKPVNAVVIARVT